MGGGGGGLVGGTNTDAYPGVFFLCGQIGCMTYSAI